MPPRVRPRAVTVALCVVPALALAALQADQGAARGTPAHAAPLGPFSVGTTTLEVTAVTWLESWNKNLSSDRLTGGRIVLGQDWKPGWQAMADLEMHRAGLGGEPDPFLVGLSGVVRRRLVPLGRTQTFLEAGLGVSLATRPVPARGTEVNFLLQAGGGLLRPLGSRTSLILGTRLWHLSNGGIIRNQRRNPDIEGIGGYAGLQVHFR